MWSCGYSQGASCRVHTTHGGHGRVDAGRLRSRRRGCVSPPAHENHRRLRQPFGGCMVRAHAAALLRLATPIASGCLRLPAEAPKRQSDEPG